MTHKCAICHKPVIWVCPCECQDLEIKMAMEKLRILNEFPRREVPNERRMG